MSERRLAEEARAGEPDALQLFFETYVRRLYAFIHARVPSMQAAEELLQETCLAALESVSSFESRSGLYTWLCGIARNKIASFLKARARGPLQIPEDGPPRVARETPSDRVQLALTALPPPYQQVLLDKYVRRRSVAEIAHSRGKTEKAIESLLSRAREAFRAAYQEEPA